MVVWLFGDWCTFGLVDESSISLWLVRSSKFLEIVLGKQFLVGQSSRNELSSWRVIRVADWSVWDLSRAVFWALDAGLESRTVKLLGGGVSAVG